MDFLNTKENLLVICPNSVRIRALNYLTEQKLLCNIKFMNKNELNEKMTFKISDEALYYLMDKYGYKLSVARMYLNNIKYALDKKTGIDKLDKLYDLKNELDDCGLLIYDRYFKDSLKNRKIVFVGYNYFDKYDLACIEELKKHTEVVIKENYVVDKMMTVHEFNTALEEIDFVANSISKVINDGVSLNQVKLCGVTAEYISLIKMVFDFYNIPINGLIKTSLYSLDLCQDFLLKVNDSLELAVNYIKEEYSDQIDLVNQIIGICNEYVGYKNIDVLKKILRDKMMATYLPVEDYEQAVAIAELDDVSVDDYVYLIGFNQNYIPTVAKDEDYISDDLCQYVLKDPSYVINDYMKKSVINNVNRLKKIVVTYRLKDDKTTYIPSYLIDDLGWDVIKQHEIDLISYSERMSKIKLGKFLDDYNKYGNVDDPKLFNSLLSSIDSDDYMSYDNSYHGIDQDYFYEQINKSLVLSYTSLNSYQECPFKYYVKEILQADSFTESFATLIGNIYHYVLQKGLLEEIDVDDIVWNYINANSNLKLNGKEMFFIMKLSDNLKFVLSEIKKSVDMIGLKDYLFEQRIKVSKKKKFDVTFKGFIDKFVYDKKLNIGAVIDYKTGSTSFDLHNTYYGFDLQVPIYLYLIRHKYKDIKFAGFYLQYILNKNYLTNDKDIMLQKKDNLKLVGYSNRDKKILECFDSNYANSMLIKSMRTNSDGEFGSYAKTVSNEEIDRLIELVDKHVDDTINGIENGDFKIQPKYIDESHDACKYCKFNDVCYKQDKDILRLEPIKDLSFLGGDAHA